MKVGSYQTSTPPLPGNNSTTLSGRALWLSFAAATTGTFMVNVDASVVNVALPTMQHQFALPIATLQWVVTGYLLIITGILPVMGQLADRLGRSRIFVAGIGIFTLGSLFSALSPTFTLLVISRIFQGLGGAIIQANVMAIVTMTFPANQRGKALGMIGSVVAAGTLAGPPIGGILTGAFGWPSIFWINIPVGLWGLWGSYHYLPKIAPEPSVAKTPFDWNGALLFLGGVALIQFGLADLHQWIGMALVAAAAVVVWFFIWWEKRMKKPLVPLRLFAVPAFSSNMIAGIMYWILMMFPAFLLPFFLRTEMHLSEGLIGLSLVPQAAVMVLVSPIGGQLADRYGILLPARLGLVVFAVVDSTMALFTTAQTSLWFIWVLLGFQGLAAGLFTSPNNTAMISSVPRKDTGMASSLIASQRNMGRALGVGLSAELLSLIWVIHGLGANPSQTSPSYPHWFLMAFHGVFLIGVLFAAIGWITTKPAQPPSN
ncbi:MAG: MFS transporter [Firmicutes bacterium]|nr:MFS transporter [Bacillota bacterium]